MRLIVMMLTVLVFSVAVWAKDKTLTVPSSPTVEGKRVVIPLAHKPAAETDQVHIFIDGALDEVVRGRTSITLELEPGTHTIELRDASRNFQLRGDCIRFRATTTATETGGSVTPPEECKP